MKDYIVRVRLDEDKVRSSKDKHYTYEYRDKQGRVLSKSEYTPYLKNIYIAPAYNPVKINKRRNDKIIAIGTDSRGRQQYTYNPQYVQKSVESKYRRLIEFGNNYKCIMKRVNKDITTFEDTKKKQIALILKMMDECNFRIGNEKYAKENKSFGVCTLETQHIQVKKDHVLVDFVGKEGVRNTCRIKNKRLVRNLKTKKKTLQKRDRVFTYRNNRNYYTVKASDVNNYLKQFGDFSGKNFRTWNANTDLIKELTKPHTNHKKHLSESIKRVATKMHHTPTICKKNYINKELMDIFVNHNDKFRYYFQSKDKEGISEDLIHFLKDIYR